MEVDHINISKFITARSRQIQVLSQVLKEKELNGGSLPHQQVNHHLRRRAMSHNPYRIPRRIRRSKDVDAEPRRCSCRKHLRSRKLLQTHYQRRSRKVQWLETHLWQTKRMKMISHFGYKVALHPNEQNTRAIYRFSKWDSIM